MFEIKAKDMRGRVGVLKTKHGNVKTPALMPVIHPRKQAIDVKKYGADIVITNAYLIYKDDDLKQKAIDEGLHKLINFDGPIMTDSGSFQLSVYGDVDITNEEVIKFQDLIKSDIGTSLDIPTAPFVDRQKAEEDLKITLERAKEAVKIKKENDIGMLLNSVVQGSTFMDLRQKCAAELSQLDADLYPIGAVVPLMESYHYKELVDVVMNSMMCLPDNTPRHLMGAGHPMIFALAVAMGCDLFDSAAYILYAEDDRLLSTRGTFKLENLQEMPCSCEVCSKYTPDDLRAMPKEKRRDLIAQHNLHVSFAELRLIRQAIYEGSLMELVEERCRAHPALLDGVRQLANYSEDMEKYDPRSKKSAFFYTGPESLGRSEVLRHQRKLLEMPKKRDLVILPPSRKPYSKFISGHLGEFYIYGAEQEFDMENTDFMVLDVPFGLIPLEIDELYPLSQSAAPRIRDVDSTEFITNFMSDFIENYEQVLIHSKVIKDLDIGLYNKSIESDEIKYVRDDLKKIKAIADYQFGVGAGEALFKGNIKIEKSKKTGKIRHIYDGKVLIVNMRASDSYLVLSKEGARRLHKALPYPKNRVVVNEDSEPFALEGKSVFSKFVIECDENIRTRDEVLIVNEADELLAYGKSLLSAVEINNFQTGQAIKTRKGFKK
ncbi:tRNA guanosine(15) transglycosylase TgtA [Methanobrevibacter millerae]|uniref:tRNA-guanine(15) transglycosylase n=1 Tax=Methanobrevibacter millerae TaxID=230361 RepID=A0A1G5WZZ4_9EURY|nr:tRNA guanosine(15) transglycosylase TgtA [Methanobrevibacter millerae]SDA62875.1 7-cyano-7-deazaguanine tRNA-ribosyltransferase [Methanobrevibacter millerae]